MSTGTLRKLARLTMLHHALFALPFAIASMLYAAGGVPPPRVILWALVALIAGRSLGMAVNRLVDRRVDAKNPRTADRPLPRGEIGVTEVRLFAIASAALLGLAAWALNPLCLRLLPVALLLLVGYSYAKYHTLACHLILGSTHAAAVGGAWIAVTGAADFPVWPLALGVMFWTAGFDVIYACQDIDFDRQHGLHSIPAALGRDGALDAAGISHLLSFLSLSGFGWVLGLSLVYFKGMAAIGLLLALEHFLARRQGDAAIQTTFFVANVGVSLVYLATAILEVVLASP